MGKLRGAWAGASVLPVDDQPTSLDVQCEPLRDLRRGDPGKVDANRDLGAFDNDGPDSD